MTVMTNNNVDDSAPDVADGDVDNPAVEQKY